MEKFKLKFFLAVLLFLSFNHAKSQTAIFQDKIVASDRQLNDNFGGGILEEAKKSISIFGDYAVVGAPGEDTGGDSTGKAYLYKWEASSCEWKEVDEIFPVDGSDTFVGQPGDQFGFSVAIYDRIIAISAPFDDNNGADGLGPIMSNTGIVYLYRINADDEAVFLQHIHQFNDLANEDELGGDNFGFSVDLSSTHLIVGTTNDDEDEDGLNPLPGAGAAFIYERVAMNYVFQNKVVSPTREIEDRMGASVAIDGDFAFVGAPEDGPGGSLVVGDGIVYIFEFVLGNWIYVDELAPFADADDWDLFGFSIDVWNNRLIVGAPLDRHDEDEVADLGPAIAGSAYIYELTGGVWTLIDKIVGAPRAGEDRFGWDVAIYEDFAVVGAPLQDPGGTAEAGSLYLFQNNAGIWNQIQHVDAPDGVINDQFGMGIDLYQKKIISSAPFQDFDDDLDAFDPPLNSAGAAYIYEIVNMPDAPNITSDIVTACTAGETITLDIPASSLGDADYWAWYEDGCDGVGIGSGTSITVNPTETTTYCARGESFCDWFTPGDCECITIEINDGLWHQSTDEGVFDRANDVITDNAGNVYATGQYLFQATFTGGISETASSGVGKERTYVVKYDKCGELVWLAWSNLNDIDYYDHGSSITFDEVDSLVYVAGNFRNGVKILGGDGVSTDDIINPGQHGYVACFDAVTGAINYMDDVTVDPITHLSAITINENNGKIYVGGEHANANPNYKVFVQRYSPSLITIGAADWIIDGSIYGPHKYLGDLDYDEDLGDSGSLWMIGGYRGSLRFLTHPGALLNSARDAFIARFEDGASPIQTFLRKGGINSKMFGEGITVDSETGVAYFTGHYKGETLDAFGTALSLPSSMPNQHAYFGSITSTGLADWSVINYTEGVLNNLVYGYDAVYKDGLVYFTGTYRNNTVFTPASPLDYFTALGEHHAYVVAYDINGTFVWHNATTDPGSGASRQTSTAITADNDGHAFISGGYTYTMGYITGTPSSGNLTAALTSQEETFIMRVDLGASGALESTTNDSDNAFVSGEDGFEHENNSLEVIDNINEVSVFKLHPNPSENIVYINISNYKSNQFYNFKIFNLQGKLVLNKMIGSNVSELDLSDISSGVYIVKLVDGERTHQVKLIKQ